jgi:hypothetical protein
MACLAGRGAKNIHKKMVDLVEKMQDLSKNPKRTGQK